MEALARLDHTVRPPYLFSCGGAIYRVQSLEDPEAPMERLLGTTWVSSPLRLGVAVVELQARQLSRAEMRALALGAGIAA